ncbi:hypothetical protein SPWS13_3816 [Shewanella putrefaciens]|nr:hypothetical protein SPWS13_3816 [Shewanella putrefaciens]
MIPIQPIAILKPNGDKASSRCNVWMRWLWQHYLGDIYGFF